MYTHYMRMKQWKCYLIIELLLTHSSIYNSCVVAFFQLAIRSGNPSAFDMYRFCEKCSARQELYQHSQHPTTVSINSYTLLMVFGVIAVAKFICANVCVHRTVFGLSHSMWDAVNYSYHNIKREIWRATRCVRMEWVGSLDRNNNKDTHIHTWKMGANILSTVYMLNVMFILDLLI